MVSKATSRFIRMSPQKARLVVDLIRGKDVNEALMTLKFTNKPKATHEIETVSYTHLTLPTIYSV